MSETSIDKTRRRLCSLFDLYDFKYQYSFFFPDGIEPDYFLEQYSKIKRSLGRKYSQPILLKVNLSAKRELHAYITMYAEQPLEEFKTFMESRFPGVAKSRVLTSEKIESTLRTINNQKPHNLNSYFKKNKVNRYSMLNGV
ncbi:hypothetical protein [Pseudomonas sp. PSPC3-3]|uniref:hypothetical protein n=1 Tax=unclassified Pseudomonas TaxID=196821 RepID=UPI003CF8D6B9